MEADNKKLIIFDGDGTLFTGTEKVYIEAIGASLSRVGIEVPFAELSELIDEGWGKPPQEIAIGVARERAIGNPEIFNANPRIFEQVAKHYAEYLDENYVESAQPVPGAVYALGRLARKYTLAVNTAADAELLFGRIFPKIGLHDMRLFQGGVLSAIDYRREDLLPKPEPDSTLELMERNNVAPHETVMIGDSLADALTAAYAGVEDIIMPLTGMTNPAQAKVFENEIGVMVVPDITYVERALGALPIRHLILSGG